MIPDQQATALSDADMIRLDVVWNRLISVCEEQANVLMRVAFGPIVRESGDLSAGIFNADGDMLAQAVTGTPGHVNTMAASVRAILEHIPAGTLVPGDALMTNDPWLGAGHVFDFVVVTPAFLNGTIVGYLASTSHVVDVGGLGWSAEGRSVFEEGVVIPVTRLRKAGELNEEHPVRHHRELAYPQGGPRRHPVAPELQRYRCRPTDGAARRLRIRISGTRLRLHPGPLPSRHAGSNFGGSERPLRQ